jgi:predicted ATPase
VELVQEHRLVVLTGAGGVGKTTVARAVAAEAASRGWVTDVVPLAAARDVAQMFRDLAQALGWRPTGAVTAVDAVPGLLSGPGPRLVVLDNLEQVQDGPTAVAGLLASCPGVRFLGTSRVALGLVDERRVPVPVLSPADASQVLIRRSSQVGGIVPSPDEALALAEALDRLPLALTLAGHWLRARAPQDLLDELGGADDGPVRRADSPRDLPDRQRSLLATVAYSVSLLPDHAERAATAVAVHAESVGPDDVAAVAGCSRDDAAAACAELVDAGLVTPQAHPVLATRYRMLPLVARAIRALAGDVEEARRRWAGHIATVVRDRVPELRSPALVSALAEIEIRHADVRALLARGTTSSGDAAALFCDLWPAWYLAGRWADLESAATALGDLLPPRGRAGLAVVLARGGRADRARAALRPPGDGSIAAERAEVWYAHGLVAALSGDPGTALTAYGLAGEAAGEAGDVALASEIRCYAGYTRWRAGDLDGARADFGAALAGSEASGHVWGVARSLFGQAETAVAAGAPSDAIPLLTRMAAIDDAIGYRRGVVGARMMSAVVSVLTGHPEDAVDPLEDARQFLSDLGDILLLSTATSALALAYARTGRPERARYLLAEADDMSAPVSFPFLLDLAKASTNPSSAVRASTGTAIGPGRT